MTAPRRLLFVHAHPDDESLMTGGTIARYLAAGVEDWSKTPDAAEFLPAPTTPAGRPGQAAPTGPRRAAQTYALV